MDQSLENEAKPYRKTAKKLIQLERTRTAFERLQLAWIRTSITILGVGVGVYEFFFNRIESGKTPLFKEFTGRELALTLYILAFIVLTLSLFQHQKSMALLKQNYPETRFSVASLLSILLVILALFLVSLLLWKAYLP